MMVACDPDDRESSRSRGSDAEAEEGKLGGVKDSRNRIAVLVKLQLPVAVLDLLHILPPDPVRG